MRRSKLLSGFALPVVGALLLASCGGGSGDGDSGDETSGGGAGGSFSIAAAEPEALAPTSACYSSDCSQVLNSVYTPLLRVNPETNEQELLMAESIESKDNKVWTIKIKDGYTFHNGEPVDAQSFARAWNYAAYGPNATQVGFFFDKVEGYDDMQGKNPKAKELSGLKVVDDKTLEVTLSAPYSQFPLRLSYTAAGAPMAEECEQDIKACNEEPIGNGPYQMAEPWQHNQSVTLEKYPDYPSDAQDNGNADQIELKIYADLKTAYRDLQSGNLDIIERVDPSQRAQAESTYPDNIAKINDGYYGYFGFPFYVEEFQDVKMRQALSLAIDRETIIERVLNGDAEPATDVLPSFIPGARDDACDYCEYDPERAKQLFEEAGGLDGPIEIWFNSDGGHEQWVQAMAQGWKQDLGIDYELKSQLFDPYLETLGTQSKVQGPYRLAWAPDYPSAENYLDPIYGAGSSNYGKWEGPEHERFIDLVAEGNQAPSEEEGIAKYQEAADVVLDNMVVIPLWYTTTFTLWSDNVDNVNYSPFESVLLEEVTVNG